MTRTKRQTSNTPAEDAPAPEKWTAERVLALLETRHPRERGEWAFFAELRSQTGYAPRNGRESYLDAFAMACWPSAGFTRVAYEIKVSRADWLDELRDPMKRAAGLKLSNEFWFAAPSGVIKPDEVPEGCGWLEVTAAGLKTRKAAPYREAEAPSLAFIASLLRWAAQARDNHTQGLGLRQAKAFRFAGRELNVDELLQAADTESDKRIKHEVSRQLDEAVSEKLETTRAYHLARAVARAMGRRHELRAEWSMPSETEFLMWLEGQRIGGLPAEVLRNLRMAFSQAAEAHRALEVVKEALDPPRRPLG